ncbi:MAG: N-acetyl-gamma-glutamyl-phosphate reductase [Alphaproteobacteria bacterium]
MIETVIFGGTGYGAGELMRLLLPRSDVQIRQVISRSQTGQPVWSAHPQLRGYTDLRFTDALDPSLYGTEDARPYAFLALPHAASAAMAAELEQQGFAVIDLSGAYRLRIEAEHNHHYSDIPFDYDLRSRFTYGLPEIVGNAAIEAAQHIANPGCLATASALAAHPLRDLITGPVRINALTGSTGAGRSLGARLHHPARDSNFSAYGALSHRHEPEIRQALGGDMATAFVPHSLPLKRGIHVTLHADLTCAMDSDALQDVYRNTYAGQPFIRITEAAPELASVTGSNMVEISAITRGRQAVVFCVLDNLVKGAAGQAIQNMNLMSGLPPQTGLMVPPLRP